MINKLIAIILSLSALTSIGFGEENRFQSGLKFTEWMNGRDYQDYFDNRKKNSYPVVVEAQPLLSGAASYRACFISFPSKDFRFYSNHGVSDKDFEKNHKKLTRDDYILIYHQRLLITSTGRTLNQATWVKSDD